MIGVVRILSLLKTHYVQARGDVEDAGADPHVSPRAPGAGRYLLAYYMFFLGLEYEVFGSHVLFFESSYERGWNINTDHSRQLL